MATNPFDQFDAPATPSATGNPFDAFDTAKPPPLTRAEPSFLGAAAKGFKRSLPETKSLLVGSGALLAQYAGAEGTRDALLSAHQDIEKQQVEPLAPRTGFIDAVTGDGSLKEWAGDTLGNFAGQALQSVAAAGAGALIGSTVPGVGNAAGAVGGLVARGAVKEGVEKGVQALVRQQIEKGVAREAAEAAGDAARRKALQRLGGGVAAPAALNVGQETGIAFTDRAADAQAAGVPLTNEDATRALGYGTAAGLLDTAAEVFAAGRALKGASEAPGMLRRVATGAAQGAAAEGATEGAQAVLERAGAARDVTGTEAYRDYIENIAAGALGGGVMGGASGVRRPDTAAPPPGPLTRAAATITGAPTAPAAPAQAPIAQPAPAGTAAPASPATAAQIPDAAVQVLSTAAKAGKAIGPQALAKAIGVDEAAATDMLRDFEARGLVSPPNKKGTRRVLLDPATGVLVDAEAAKADQRAAKKQAKQQAPAQAIAATQDAQAGAPMFGPEAEARMAEKRATALSRLSRPNPAAGPASAAGAVAFDTGAADVAAQAAAQQDQQQAVAAQQQAESEQQRAIQQQEREALRLQKQAQQRQSIALQQQKMDAQTYDEEDVRAVIESMLDQGQRIDALRLGKQMGVKPRVVDNIRRAVFQERSQSRAPQAAGQEVIDAEFTDVTQPGAARALPPPDQRPGQIKAVQQADAQARQMAAGMPPPQAPAAPASPAQATVAPDDTPEVLDDDITLPSGEPFTIRGAADLAAKRNPGARVVQVDGGFVARLPREATGKVSSQVATATVQESGTVQPTDGSSAVPAPSPATVKESLTVAAKKPKEAIATDVAGEQLDDKWTAFAPETGTLNVPRAQMPQIKSAHRGAMVQFLGARGITSEQAEVPADSLKPTQAEFSAAKVKKAIKRAAEGEDRAILVSADGHVLDGHHQWLAKREAGAPVKVIRLGAPIAQLLEEIKQFPSATTANGATQAKPEQTQQEPANAEQTTRTKQAPATGKAAEAAAKQEKALLTPAAPAPAASTPAKRAMATVIDNGDLRPGEFIVRDAGTGLARFELSPAGRPIRVKFFYESEQTRNYAREAITAFATARSNEAGKVAAVNAGLELPPVDATPDLAQDGTTEEGANGTPESDGAPALDTAPAGKGRGAQEAGATGGSTDSGSPPRVGTDSGTDGAGVSGARGGRGGKGRVPAAETGAAAGGRLGGSRTGRARKAVPGADAGVTQPAEAVASTEPTNVPAINFKIEADLELGKGGEVGKFNDNVAAIRTLKQIESERRRATPEEQRTLARWVGWGGLASAFPNPETGKFKDGWEKRGNELRELLTPSEYQAARRSTRNAHFTSETVVGFMWDAVRKLGYRGGLALESSMGSGNFLGLMPDDIGPTKFIGVEYDSITARLAAALYPQATVLHSGFQSVPLPNDSFDLSIGNPPFGNESLRFQYKPELRGLSIHNQFFLAAMDALKPGGLQVQVVSNFLLDAQDSQARRMLADRADLVAAFRLPDTAFKENARTEVVTDVLILRKREYRLSEMAKDKDGKPTEPSWPDWVSTGTAPDPLGGDPIPLNNYFIQNPDHIIGTLERSGKMRAAGMPNVRLEDPSTLGARLQDMLGRLRPLGRLTETTAERTERAHKLLSEAMGIAVANQEPGHMAFDAAGGLVRVIEREHGDETIMQRQQITADSPWSPQLFVDAEGRWYKVDVKMGEDGKPLKQTDASGAPTRFNAYTRTVYATEAEVPSTLRLGKTGYERLKGMVALRDLLKQQLVLETEDATAQMEPHRKKLAAAYRAYVAEHGPVNRRANAALLSQMPDGAMVLALESSYEPERTAEQAKRSGLPKQAESVKPAPILSERVVPKYEPATKAETPADALAITLAESGRVDMERIAALLGQDLEQAADALTGGDKPLVFKDPESNTYETADAYLSGQVVRKLQAARAAGLEQNIKALQAIQPEPWGAENVLVQMGATWVPADVYATFAQQLLGAASTHASFAPVTNTFSLTVNGVSPARSQQWNVEFTNKEGRRFYMSAVELLQSLLNSKTPVMGWTDQDGRFHVDKDATTVAIYKGRELATEFGDWIFKDSERRARLVGIFNERYNTRVTRQYDGQHLTLPGKVPDTIIKMRRHQKNAIWRGISSRFLLIDHVVGAGKTFTAIARAMERRRMGLARKPTIVVPNHLVEQWQADIYRLYPGAKVLAATKADFEMKRRRRLLGRVATGDYDIVVLPHSSFGFIGIAPETELRYLEEDLAKAVQAVKDAEADAEEEGQGAGNRRFKPMGVKEAERLVAAIENRMGKLREGVRDRLLTFEQLGIDDLTIDEAHEFKNLFYSSRLTKVRGMGDKQGSRKAADLYNKVRLLRDSNGSVVFMTGTPVSNSVVELYSMMRYLASNELAELGMEHFDAWRAQFVDAAPAFEPNEAGQLKEVTRLGRSWSNMRSLMDLYYSFTDAVTIEDIKKWYAEDNAGARFPVPVVKGGDRQLVKMDPTPAQEEMLSDVLAGFNSLDSIQDIRVRNATRLRLMDRARKLSLDARAVDPTIQSKEEGGKLEKVSKEVKRIYDKWSEDRGTQLIFLDRSVPKAKGDDKVIKAYDALVKKRDAAALAGDDEAFQDADELLEAYDANEIEAMRSAQAGGWNAYQQIKDNLVAMGIPAEEIRFVQEANTDEQKQALFDAVNGGKVRVLIGSTPRMGAGTNVQKRLVGLHHVDVTWKPSDIEQREGRIVRFGNDLLAKYGDKFEVEILAYATERTVDAKMWSLNATKLKAINGLRKYTGDFTMEVDDEESVSMAEMAALASGNPLLLERVTLEAQLNYLELQEKSHRRQLWGLSDALDRAQRIVDTYPATIEDAKAQQQRLATEVDALVERAKARRVTVDGEVFDKEPAALKAALASIQRQQAGNENARYAVTINGARLTNRKAIDEAIGSALGDASAFEAEVGGSTYTERTAAGRAVADALSPKVEGAFDINASGTIGQMLGMPLHYEIRKAVDTAARKTVAIELWLEDEQGRTVASAEAADNQVGIVLATAKMRDLMGALASEVAFKASPTRVADLQRTLERSKRDVADIGPKVNAPFPKTAELESKRARLGEVIAQLTAAPPLPTVQSASPAVPDVQQGRHTFAKSGEPPRFSPATARAWQALADIPGTFQRQRTDAKSFEDIARAILPDAEVIEFEDGATITVPPMKDKDGQVAKDAEGNPGKPKAVTMTILDGQLAMDASQLQEGVHRGSALYSIALAYAHNNGVVFIPDPADVSEAAMQRRGEHMLSSALKYGTTRHMVPHEDQGLDWRPGDDQHNVLELIRASADNVLDNIPETESLDYDWDSGRFIDTAAGGKPVTTADFERIAESGAGRKARAGVSTLRRGVVSRSLERRAGTPAWRGVVARLLQLGRAGLRGSQLEGILYGRGAASKGTDPARLRALFKGTAARLKDAHGIDLQVLDSADALPQSIRDQDDYDDTVQAVITGDRRTVYLIANRIRSPEAAFKLAAHELVGHFAMEKMLGPRLFAELQQRIKALADAGKWPEVFAEVRRRYERNADGTFRALDDATFASEAIAVFAEKNIQTSILQRAINAVRGFLRRIFPQLELSQGELRQMLWEAGQYLEGRAYRPEVAARALGEKPAPKAESLQDTMERFAFGRTNERDTFYSALLRAIEEGKGLPKAAGATQWKQWLDGAQRRGEVKQSERDWIGVDAWLDGQQGNVTREALADFVRANRVQVQEVVLGGEQVIRDANGRPVDDGAGGVMTRGQPTKYDGYRTPGGENYRELLLTLPAKDSVAIKKVRSPAGWGDTDGGDIGIERTGDTGADYRSGHWDQPNVLAHVRFDEREVDGKRVLFVQEIQSDWHQEGRKKGYAGAPLSYTIESDDFDGTPFFFGVLSDGRRTSGFDSARLAEIAAKEIIRHEANGVPDAPLKATDEWAMLAFKRMARWAVDNGFDTIAWTTGEQAAEVFDLSKQVDSIDWLKNSRGYAIAADKGGRTVIEKSGMSEDDLASTVGKEVAEKIVSSGKDFGKLSGLDLKVGGEGMRGFYDKILPAAVGKWAKKFGAKVGEAKLDTGRDAKSKAGLSADAHSIDITPAMRAAVAEGQPLFAKGAEPTMLERLQDAINPDDTTLLQWIKDKWADWRPAALGALTLRHLGELAKNMLPAVSYYSDLVQRMASMRNELQESGHEIMQKGLSYLKANREEAPKLFELLHDATIAGVDPAEAYKPLKMPLHDDRTLVDVTKESVRKFIKELEAQMRLQPGSAPRYSARIKEVKKLLKQERARAAAYPAMKARWNALSTPAKDQWVAMRDAYTRQSGAYEQALLERIQALDMAGGQKAAMGAKMRAQFEAARVAFYVPLARWGEYWVSGYTADGERVFLLAETQAEQRRAREQMKVEGVTGGYMLLQDGEPLRHKDGTARIFGSASLAQGWANKNPEKAAGAELRLLDVAAGVKLDKVRQQDGASGAFMVELQKTLKQTGAPDSVLDEVYQLYLRTLPDLSIRKNFIHRKKTAGYSQDALRAFAGHVFHGSFQIARLAYSYQLEGALRGAEGMTRNMATDGDERANAAGRIVNELKRRHEWVMNPQDNKLVNKLSGLGFVWYLGITPGAALVNLLQTPMVTLPVLASKYGANKATAALLRASKEAMGTYGHIEKKLSPDELEAYNELRRRGAIDKTQAHNLAGVSESDTHAYNPFWHKVMTVIGHLFHKAEVINREASGMAAYRLARDAGKDKIAAIKEAEDAIWESHFDYSNANRARFMQSGTAKVLLMFRQFALNMTWFLGRNAWIAMKGATKEQKTQARRKLAGVLGMHAVFAGTLGLPLMSVTFGVLNAVAGAFGDDDEPWDAETEFRTFLRETLGDGAAEAVLRGPVQAATGVNIAQRVSLNDLWFRDADRELEGRAWANYLFEQAAGPLGGIVTNYARGRQLMDEGHLWRGIETMMPKAVKDGMKAIRFQTEGVNTLRGDPVIEDFGVLETIGQLTGLAPARVAEQFDLNRDITGYADHIESRRRALMDAFAMAVRMGDDEARAQVMEKMTQFSRTYPERAITGEGLRRSLLQRARYSAQAQGGVVIPARLRARLQERLGMEAPQ